MQTSLETDEKVSRQIIKAISSVRETRSAYVRETLFRLTAEGPRVRSENWETGSEVCGDPFGEKEMSARAKVNELLNNVGAVLKRARNHEVWTLPGGRNFVRGRTPSDHRADANNLSDLKRTLGIVKPAAAQHERKLKHLKRGAAQPKTSYRRVETLSLAQSLRMAGLTDEALRDRMAVQELRMCEIEQRLAEAENHLANCWACRLSGWLKSKLTRIQE